MPHTLGNRSFVYGCGQLCCVALLFAIMAGCGDGRPTRVPVSGKVLIDGEPLKFGAVIFVPENGRSSAGNLDDNGHFTLTCFTPGDGALLGKHKIQVFGSDVINNTTTRVHAPKKYGDLQNSGLVQEINGPTDSVVINLTWKGNVPDKPYTETSGSAGDELPRWKSAARK
jgi:hypothetical protein